MFRSAKFALFAILLTPLSHFWYGLLERLFAGKSGRLVNILKLLLDQALFDPFVTAFFFVVMGTLEGKVRSGSRSFEPLTAPAVGQQHPS